MNRWRLLLAVWTAPAWGAVEESFPVRENGTVVAWTVAGPLPNAVVSTHSQACVGYYQDYLKDQGGESKALPAETDRIAFGEGKAVTWQTAFSDPAGFIDYNALFASSADTPGVAYAFCRLSVPDARKVLLKIRSNDGVRVWVNEEMIHDHHVGRTIEQGEDRVPATLRQGANRLLVKVDQSGGGWGFVLAVTGPDGNAATGLISSVYTARPLAGRIDSVQLTASPVCLNTPDGQRQLATLDVVSGGLQDVTCRITRKDWPQPQEHRLGDLSPGHHTVELQVPAISENASVNIQLTSAAQTGDFPDVPLSAPRRWVVYLVQHVHTDIGYTRPQTEILPEHLRYIDYALDFCDLTDSYPDDARFRWTCEVSWAVREYLKRRPPEQIARLRKRIAEGRIEVAGMFLNMAEIATESSLAASLQSIRTLTEDLGAPVRTAMQNDVNGAAWCLVDYFHGIGLKYLTMGINKTRSLLPFDIPTPFWWESPAGKRILAFRADHYHTGNFWKIHTGNLDQVRPGVLEYLRSLEHRRYPFDRISVQFSGYHTDNSPPAMKECDLVRAWNEKYAWPKLRIATAGEFLRYVEADHAAELPVHRVAWPDWWTDGFGSAARETAASRRTHAEMQATQGLLSMAAILGTRRPPDVMARATSVQENLLFYDEHTYGAAESVSDPLAENTMVQWGEKSSYVWEAVKGAGMLREEALGLLQGSIPRADVPTITVFNTLSWPRSGLIEVFIDHEILPSDRTVRIIDIETGRPAPTQPLRSRHEGSYWAVWAQDVPPLGYRSYRIEVSPQAPAAPPAPDAKAVSIENSFYALTLDPRTAAITGLRDKETNRELFDPSGPWKLGQLIYERLAGQREFHRDAFQRTAVQNVRLQGRTAGPIWKSLQFLAEMEGCSKPDGIRGEIRLYETEKRIELHFLARKLPVKAAEAIYVAFPFQSPGDRICYEAQGGLVYPGQNQLPGSSSDWQTVQNFIAVRSPQGQILCGSDEVPLVQFGDINLGKWQPITRIDKPHVYSWVMNNYWFTNFRVSQEGEFKWSYYLTSTPDPSNVRATRFGWGSRVPLVPRVLPPAKTGPHKPSHSTLNCRADNLLLVETHPARYSDGIVLQWREVEGKPTALNLSDQPFFPATKAADEVNVVEQTLKSCVSDITFAPYEVKFVKLAFK